jgi:DNA polymerase-3 subunit beta
MEIQLQREDLLAPLQGVVGVVERRQTLPILGNVRIEAEESGAIRLTTTDMEVEMTAEIASGGRDAGVTTASARKLLDICRALPEGSELHLADEQGRLQLQAGSSHFALGTLEAEEFPRVGAIEDGVRFSLERGVLQELLKRTSFAMAQQDVRHYLTGLLLEVSAERLRAVCTDGHRLALCDAEEPPRVEEERSVIVPRKAVMELERLLSQAEEVVEVTLSARYARFSLGTLGMTTKLIDAQFPDYNRVVPPETNFNILVDRGPLREAVTRVAILANEKFRGVRFEAQANALKLTTHNPESEEAEESVTARYEGDAFITAFNAGYLQEALGVLDSETVNFGFTAADSSTLIQQPDTGRFRYVIMPIRL